MEIPSELDALAIYLDDNRAAVIAGADVQFPWTDDEPDADCRVEEEDTVESVLGFFMARWRSVVRFMPD